MPIKQTCSYAIKCYHTFWQILHINVKEYVYLINFCLVEGCLIYKMIPLNHLYKTYRPSKRYLWCFLDFVSTSSTKYTCTNILLFLAWLSFYNSKDLIKLFACLPVIIFSQFTHHYTTNLI